MQLTPEFLPVGSIVEYNIGTLKEPEYIPTTLDGFYFTNCVLAADFKAQCSKYKQFKKQ